MADRLAGGKLADTIGGYRSQGFSLTDITRRLYATHGIEVSVATLSKWVDEVERAEAS